MTTQAEATTVKQEKSLNLRARLEELRRLYSVDVGKEWLIVAPGGFFDGSAGAWQFVAYGTPDALTLAGDEATLRRFHRPGLLAAIWKKQTAGSR